MCIRDSQGGAQRPPRLQARSPLPLLPHELVRGVLPDLVAHEDIPSGCDRLAVRSSRAADRGIRRGTR
eukprot:1618289-Heterocapsa_arctica.AAC.1